MSSKYDENKPSRAVVAINGVHGVVLWAVGHINDEIKEDGPDADALGLLDENSPDSGIWVWEGFYNAESDVFGTYTLPDGTFRPPTDSEWRAIQQGECPWHDGLWLRPNLLTVC